MLSVQHFQVSRESGRVQGVGTKATYLIHVKNINYFNSTEKFLGRVNLDDVNTQDFKGCMKIENSDQVDATTSCVFYVYLNAISTISSHCESFIPTGPYF